MKKILTYLLAAIVCGGIGYGVAMGIDFLFGDHAEGNAIDKIKLIKAVALAFVALVVSFSAQTILHEAGHLVGGWLTGYKFLSFRVGNLMLQRLNDGWHWKKFNVFGTLGQCLMCPPESADLPYFWYNAGGVVINLLLSLIAGGLLWFYDLQVMALAFCMMLLATGVFLLLMNAIPMKVGGVPNDGMNLLILWRHPDQRKYFRHMMAVNAGQNQGQRLKEMPGEWFESVPITRQSTVMELSARNLHYCRLMDELRFAEAKEIVEEIMDFDKEIPGMFQLEVAADQLLLELVTQNRKEEVSQLWNKKFERMAVSNYIQSNSKYLPIKCAILFAYEMINNQNPETAQSYYDEVKSKLETYAIKGEALTALALMDEIIYQSRQAQESDSVSVSHG